MLLLLDGLCDNLRSYSVLRRSSSVTSPPGSPSATSPKAAISSGDVSSSFLSLSSSVSSPPKSSTPNSSATIQAVCEDSSRVEKSVPQFALLTTFLHNLCSAALAAPPPPPPFLHSSASCLCRRPSLFQRYEGGHHACGSCWIVKLTTSALKIMLLKRLDFPEMKFSLYLWAMSLLAALLVKDLVFQMEHAKIAQRDILKWCNGIVGLGFSLRIEILSTMRAVQGSLIVASCIQIILGFSQIWAICSRFFSRLGMVPVIALVGFELFDRGFLEVGSWVEISMLILFIALSQDKGITRQIPSKTKRSTHDYVGLVNI